MRSATDLLAKCQGGITFSKGVGIFRLTPELEKKFNNTVYLTGPDFSVRIDRKKKLGFVYLSK